VRYRIDETFARGTAPLILWLAVTTLVMIFVSAVLISLIHATISSGQKNTFWEALWASMLRSLDPGSIGSDVGWDFRFVSLAVTLGGIFIVSTLIGLIATGLDRWLEGLREGRSQVVERGHTLILGYSQKLTAIVAELVEANANQKDACVVVLSTTDKSVVEQEIRNRVGDLRTTRVVCRTGDGSDPVDLEIVNPLEAKSIVILAPDGERNDGFAIRTVLSLMTFDPDLVSTQIVAELHSTRSAVALDRVARHNIITIVSDDVVGRLAAQSCREDGLSTVYQELFDFSGDEIYFHEEPNLTGRTFAEAALAFDAASVFGLRYADHSIELAPDPSTMLGPGDQVIAVAEDDDTIVFTGLAGLAGLADPTSPASDPVARFGAPSGNPEHIVMSGWSVLGPIILTELDQYVHAGSTVHIAADPQHCDLPAPADFAHLANLTVQVSEHDHHDLDRLLRLFEARRPDHVLLVCYRDRLAPTQADAEVLMSLMQLRHLLDDHPSGREPTIVAELLDSHDVPLARTSGADDFLVSDRLTSLLIAQLAENPELQTVFEDLLDVEGAEIHLWPVPDGVTLSTYADAVRLGLAHGDAVIGYRATTVAEGVDTLGGGIVVNPPKGSPARLTDRDQLIVVTRRG